MLKFDHERPPNFLLERLLPESLPLRRFRIGLASLVQRVLEIENTTTLLGASRPSPKRLS
ncbi:hypothetical protein ACFIOY_37365 [Bradyrhizobium sp. TZ2]